MCTSPPPHTEAGSDTQNADLDEQRRTNKSNGSGLIATGLNMRPYEELAPIYVFKNLVVKPVRYIYTLKHPPWLVFQALDSVAPSTPIVRLNYGLDVVGSRRKML